MSIYREASPVAPAPRCPRDGSELAAHVVEATTLHVCARCSGVWIDVDTLVALLQSRTQMDGLALHPLATPASGRGSSAELDNVRALPCVRCGRDSERRFYGEATSIVVDSCEQHGIWLDGGELNAVIRYARGEAKPLPGDALGARRAALRGTSRRARRTPALPPPPREYDADVSRAHNLADLLSALLFLFR